jgi:HAE1 family hydrophobic/amphiphilic exporter-1
VERLARFATERPVAITVSAVAVALLGSLAWRQLPLDLLPDVESPTIVVSVRSSDRPPTEMERLYGEQVEQRLFTVRGIRRVAQVARTGRLIASVVFDWEVDMDLALVEVQKAINPVAADPEVDEVLVRRFDPRQAPVLAYGLVAPSGQPDLAELRRLARRQVAPALEQLAGVAEVRILGGREKEVQVLVDRYRLEAHGLTLGDLESRLQAENVDIDAGTLEEGSEVYLVRGISRFRRPEDVAEVVVRYTTDAEERRRAIRVRDVADVRLEDAEIDHLVRIDGEEGVGLQIYKEAGANTVEVSRTVRRALEGLGADLPAVEARLVSDEAALIEDALGDLQVAAGVGVALAVCVLALFLRSLGATAIVATAVPVSILTALFLMRFAEHSLNIVTLAGLALGAGMLVDNAIVVVESIHRRHEDGVSPDRAAATGTAEVAGAIVASTLTTCVVFLPVLFVRGLAARLIEGIAFTVVVSLVASLAVAMLLIPALAHWLLAHGRGRRAASGPAPAERPHGVTRRLERLVASLLRRPVRVVLAALLLAAASVLALTRLGTELLPPADPRQFSLRLVGPPGQRVEATARMVETLEGLLRDAAGEDGVEAILSEVGRMPEDDRLIRSELTEENTARTVVRLADQGRTGRQVVQAVAPALEGLPESEISWEVGVSALSSALGTSGPPVVVEIVGESLADLRRAAESVRSRLAARPELWNVRSSFEGGPPEVRVVLDRALADGLGVDLDTLGRVLEAALDGRRVTTLVTGDEERDVVLRLPSPRREDLAALPFSTKEGRRLAVGEVASFTVVEGAREIFRRDQRRLAQVTSQIADGADYPAAIAAAAGVVNEVDLPPGLFARLGGEEEERAQTFRELGWAAALSVVLVLMVLAGTFESLLHPLTVLSAIPLALVGVAAALVPTGNPIGVMAMLGLIVLGGVAVNDAVLLLATARRLMSEGHDPEEALVRAAGVRLRPIVMTTLTTAFALFPLALGVGEAAQLRSPMALTIIGGIVASTVGSLLVLPCIYLLLERLQKSLPRWRAQQR